MLGNFEGRRIIKNSYDQKCGRFRRFSNSKSVYLCEFHHCINYKQEMRKSL